MTNKRIIVASTSIVHVNTAIDSNAIVLLSTPTYFGETFTIKDVAGLIYPLTISTASSITFYKGISSFLIQQPFGSLTVSAVTSNLWQLQNTFGYKQGQLPSAASMQNLQTSTLQCVDADAPGATDLLQCIDEILYVNCNSYISGSNNFKTITTGAIHASTLSLSAQGPTCLTLSGALKTNYVAFDTIQQLRLSNTNLYKGSYPINPIRGHIEFNYRDRTSIQYPLSIGSLSNMKEGWWGPFVTADTVTGFVTDPGYSLTVWSSNNYTGSVLVYTSNTGYTPVYSNIVETRPIVAQNVIGGLMVRTTAQQYTSNGYSYVTCLNETPTRYIETTFSVIYNQSQYITSGIGFDGINTNMFYIHTSSNGSLWTNVYQSVYSSAVTLQLYNTIGDPQYNRFVVAFNPYDGANVQRIHIFSNDGTDSMYEIADQPSPNAIAYGNNIYILYKTNNNSSNIVGDQWLLVTSNIGDSDLFTQGYLPEICNNIQYSPYHSLFFAAAGSNLYTSSNGSTWNPTSTSNISPLSPFQTVTNVGEFYINQHTLLEQGLPTFVFPDLYTSNLYYTYDENPRNISNIYTLWVPAREIYGVKRIQETLVVYGSPYAESPEGSSSYITILNATNFYNSNYTTIVQTGLASLTSLAVNTDYTSIYPSPASYTLQAIP